jgi:hypothetical protein
MTIEGAGFAAAVAAMSQIQKNVAQTAERMAGAAAGGDQLDLSAEMLALMQSRAQHAALANVAQAAEEFSASTISMLG